MLCCSQNDINIKYITPFYWYWGEFDNINILNVLGKLGIQQCLTMPYCSEKSEYIEKENRTVAETPMARFHAHGDFNLCG